MASIPEPDHPVLASLDGAHVNELKVGDIMTCVMVYKVMDIGDTTMRLKDLHGKSFSSVHKDILRDEFTDVLITREPIKVSGTKLTEVLAASMGNPVRVGFYKKQDAKRRKEMILQLKAEDLVSDSDSSTVANSKKRRLASFAERLGLGELRVLVGKVIGQHGEHGGRFTMEDFYPSDDGRGNQRLVDSRTLLWVDVRGTRYVNKDYKGLCEGGEIPRHSGKVDYRGIDPPPVSKRTRS